jgi:two-component system OmpR family sensor kinase
LKRGDHSLSAVLTRRLALIALAVAFVNLAAVALRYMDQPSELARSALHREIDRLDDALRRQNDPTRLDDRVRRVFLAHPQDYAFTVLDADGRTLAAANPGLFDLDPDWVRLGRSVDATIEHAGRDVRISARAIQRDHDTLYVVVGMGSDPARWMLGALLGELAVHVALPMVPVVLLLIGSNAALVRQAMRPVTGAAAWARGLRPGLPNAPPPVEGSVPDEIRDLVDALGRATERLDAGLSAERRRSAEAAHALRTPLAVLTARLDALPPGPIRDSLQSDLRQLARTVQQLLSAAAAETTAPADEVVDLAAIAGAVVAQLAPFAHAHGAELALHVDPGGADGCTDPASVELALSNLVENAVLHGGRTVTVTAGPGPCLRVRDDGPGLPENEGLAIFDAFQRGPHAFVGGAGLGLSIVRRAMDTQRGTVSAHTHPEGGAEFVLRFRDGPTPPPIRN